MKKGYIGVVSLFLVVMMITTPMIQMLEQQGVISDVAAGTVVAEPIEHTGPFSPFLNAFEELKWSIKNTYTNYMLNYSQNVMAYNKVLRFLNQPLAFLKTNRVTMPDLPTIVPPASTDDPVQPVQQVMSVSTEYLGDDSAHRHYLITMTDNFGGEYQFIDTALLLSETKKAENMKQQAALLNRLYQANTDVDFYLYVAQRMQDTPYYESLVTGETSTNALYNEFFTLLDDGIVYDTFELTTVFDRCSDVFKTDHHWNQKGSYRGYIDIIEMMRKDHPEILPARSVSQEIILEGTKSYGSFSRGSSYADLHDVFTVNDYALPSHTVSPKYVFNNVIDNLLKHPSKSIRKNIYADCFPKLTTFHYPENKTGRNLLVIGDSYSQGISEVLASNFDNAYFCYFTAYPGMDYNKVIEEKNITDVLVLQFSERIIFDVFGDSRLDEIRIR